MAKIFHEEFLPYPASVLREHFVASDLEDEDSERHLTAWGKRLSQVPDKDSSFLHRDETLWTAGALLALQRSPDRRRRWRAVMERVYGGAPPTLEGLGWDDMLGDDLALYLEVGLSSPRAYREWLSKHLDERQALRTQRATSARAGLRLEGRTHLDALLASPSTGFAVHFEAKVLSDIDTKTKHDSLRNQLARNLDCMADAKHALLDSHDVGRRFLILLTPALFHRHWQSRPVGRRPRSRPDPR